MRDGPAAATCSGAPRLAGRMGGAHLLMNLLGGLCVAEGHGGQVLQDGHLHGAVSAVEQRHQGAGVQGAVHDLGADTWEEGGDRVCVPSGRGSSSCGGGAQETEKEHLCSLF